MDGLDDLRASDQTLLDRMDGLSHRMDGLERDLRAEIAALGLQVKGIAARLDSLMGQLEGVSGRIDALEMRVDGTNARIDRLTDSLRVSAAVVTLGQAPAPAQ